MDPHLENLENLCRICGSRFSRHASRRYLCIQYAETLEASFGVKIQDDQKDVHPKSFCINCFASMNLHTDRLKAGLSYLSTLSPRQWSPHVDDSCFTCQLNDTKAKGGRPKKGKHLGRPPQTGPNRQPVGTSALVHDVRITMQQVTSFRGKNMTLQAVHFAQPPPPLSLQHFTCKLCGNILDQPVELSCNHTFCGDCIVHQAHSGNCQCHIKTCKSNITVGGIKKPSELLMASLGALQYQCTNGSCTTTVRLQRLRAHLSLCTGAPASLLEAHTPSRITLRQVLDAPNTSTPSTAERRVLGHLTQRMMTSSSVYSSDNIITVPTGGQVCCRNKTKQNHFHTIYSEYIHSTTWIVRLTRAQYKTKTDTNFMITYMHKVNLNL